MALEVDDKTEQPTERRRREAREDGRSPRSADLSTACRLLGVAAALQFFGAHLVIELAQLLTDALQRPWQSELTADLIVSRTWDAAGRLTFCGVGGCCCIWVCGLAAHFLQVGFRFRVGELWPDISRLNPTQGLTKLWRIENASQAGWGFVKYVTSLSIGGWFLWTNLGHLSTLADSDVATIAQFIGYRLITLAWLLAAVFLAFGLSDYGYQLWKFEQSLKMSPAEVREEARNEGGSAQWKHRRRELWQQRSQS